MSDHPWISKSGRPAHPFPVPRWLSEAIALANRVLDRPHEDPDSDMAILARGVVRLREAHEPCACGREAALAQPSEPGLDVERAFSEGERQGTRAALEALGGPVRPSILGLVMDRILPPLRGETVACEHGTNDKRYWPLEAAPSDWAECIAAEYARLASEPTDVDIPPEGLVPTSIQNAWNRASEPTDESESVGQKERRVK